MSWNIRQFGITKTNINGFTTAVARTILAANVDIVAILETTAVGIGGLQALGAYLRAIDPNNDWACVYSPVSGTERYAFYCRSLNTVRPMAYQPNPNIPPPAPDYGSSAHPLRDLDTVQFTTWPDNAWQPAPQLPNLREIIPLIDVFVEDHHERAAKKPRTWAGQSIANGGNAVGAGTRRPCLALFHIRVGNNNYYLPIVVCHFGAVRSLDAANAQAYTQMEQTTQLHITQKYAARGVAQGAVVAGYLDVDHAPAGVAVQSLVIMGDWNVDFMVNNPNGAAPAPRNYRAFSFLTPTQESGGSAPPPVALPNGVRGPGTPTPAIPPPAPFAGTAVPPHVATVPQQTLTPAVTSQGTILLKQNPATIVRVTGNPNGATSTLRNKAIDLDFYGLPPQVVVPMLTPGPPLPPQSGQVIDLPANIVQRPPQGVPLPPLGPQIDVSDLQTHYAARGAYFANYAIDLHGGPAATPLVLFERWVGALMISDHVPVVVEFTFP